jgi:hypothetical protein
MKKEPVKESDFERRVCEVLVKRLGGEVKGVGFNHSQYKFSSAVSNAFASFLATAWLIFTLPRS